MKVPVLYQDACHNSFKRLFSFAYIKFFTEKRVVLKRFTRNEDLMNQAKICSGAGKWEPKVPLIKRYLRFKNSKRDKFILSKIKENIV